MNLSPSSIVLIIIVIFLIIITIKNVKIVPQKAAYIVERLGKYKTTLEAGLHVLVPFIDKIAYKHTLKEQAVDVPSQTCITKDNISVEVDGILYMQVVDAQKASYGIGNYAFAAIQLAQTTMRSVMGRLDLDKTFEERDAINQEIVDAVDKASDPWGVKVTRYEVKNIVPPQSIKEAMEKQMKAEREKRATIAESEGYKQSAINKAEGERNAAIAQSEGERQKKINIADGKSYEIQQIAEATSISLKKIAAAINEKSGTKAVNMRLAEQYLSEFGNLAKENNSMIIPSNLADISGIIKAANSVVQNNSLNTENVNQEGKS